MGLADLVQAEETVSIRVSEYRELIENNTELDMLRQVSNGTAPEVYVRILRKGAETAFSDADREELRAYRETGITPDRFQVIDEEYRKLSKKNAGLKEEAARLTEEKAKLFDQVKALEQKCKGLEESSRNYYLGCGKKQGQIDALGAQIAELRGAVQERDAQIEDLKKKLAEKEAYIHRLQWGMVHGIKVENDGE